MPSPLHHGSLTVVSISAKLSLSLSLSHLLTSVAVEQTERRERERERGLCKETARWRTLQDWIKLDITRHMARMRIA